MAVNARSEFLKNVKAYSNEAATAVKEKGSSFLDDAEIVKLLNLEVSHKSIFDAKLSAIRYGVDKNKQPYFAFNFVLITGRKGLQVGNFIGLPKDKEQRAKRLKMIANYFDALGHDFDGVPAAKLMDAMADAADGLTTEKPCVTLALKKYVGNDGVARLNLDIVAMIEDGKIVEQSHEDDVSNAPDFLEYGTKADEGDEEAVEFLTALGEQLEVDVNGYGTWYEFAEYANEAMGASVAEEPAEEEATEVEEGYADVVEVSDEEREYFESCVEWPCTYNDGNDEIEGTVQSYDVETNTFTVACTDGTEITIPAADAQF
jgi:hypothetical protein